MDTRKITHIPRYEVLEISEKKINNNNRKTNRGCGLVGWPFLDEEIKRSQSKKILRLLDINSNTR